MRDIRRSEPRWHEPLEVAVLLPSQGTFAQSDAAVVVRSDVPIFAESTIYTARGATRAPGIPSR